ncbi:MAG: MFS transporter [Clostridia bacterium]|nr:MFS transporter [Clostridia bacterium]
MAKQPTEVIPTNPNTYTKKERNYFLIGLFGQNIMYNVVASCLMYYLQFTVLIPAMTVSVIFTVARIFDAINDPIMGTIVDRTRSRFGKCVPYLRIIPIPVMIISILCYVSFGFYGDGSPAMDVGLSLWAAFTYILWGVTYTIGDIPLWGVTSLMTDSEKDRNNLLTAARVVAAIGGGIVMLSMQSLALGLGGKLTESLQINAMVGEKYGFLITAAVISLIGTVTFLFAGFGVKERIKVPPKKTNFKENLSIIVHNKPYMQILISGVLGSTKTIIAIVAMTIVTYYYASKDPIMALVYMILLGGGFFLGQFAFMLVTPALNKKISKKHLYNWSNILSIVPYALIFVAYLIDPHHLNNIGWLLGCFVLFGIAGGSNGITTVLQSQMIADCVNYEEYKSGRRPDALFFSGQTFLVKLQNGLATIFCGVAYTIVHFSDTRVAEVNAFITAGGIPRLAGEYSSFMMILFLIISIPPAIGCLLTVIPTWKYALDDKEHARILAELIERRKQNAIAQETLEVVGEVEGTAEVAPVSVEVTTPTAETPEDKTEE